jgi:hypothetical protein
LATKTMGISLLVLEPTMTAVAPAARLMEVPDKVLADPSAREGPRSNN